MTRGYLVIDVESSGTTTYRRFCNPLDLTHQVDLLGYKYQGQSYCSKFKPAALNVPELPDLDNVSVIVGHNVKFDLLWFWGQPKLQEWLQNGGRIWDTLTVQYLLDGQRRTRRSLDDLALKYGGTLKDSRMKEFYKEGGQSKDVDINELLAYNEEDVNNTTLVLQAQLKIVKEKKMMSLIEVYMEHYTATIEMEYNGIYVNGTALKQKTEGLKKDGEAVFQAIADFATAHEYANFNPLSLDDLSLFLLGGTSKVRKQMPQYNEDGSPIIVKKTGEVKVKYEILLVESKGLLNPNKFKELVKNKKGHYFLTDDTLEYIRENTDQDDVNGFIKNILEYRKLTKKIGTYYEGLLECQSVYTNCVHPEFKTAFTDTGRLSSINPNAQNLVPEVLDYIESRYKGEGCIVEMDFSQLEIRLQAYITDCYEMMSDIEKGVDFHILRLSYAEGLSYEDTYKLCHEDHEWALKRKAAKTISFQKAYGASPAKIAESTGLSEHVVKSIFYQEDERYPEIKEFYENISQHLSQTRTVTSSLQKIRDKLTGLEFTKEGEQQGLAMYKSITNKEYLFDEKAVLTKTGQIFRYFNMPKIQNSPVQGIAADFVSCQIGQFYRWLKKSGEKCWMIDEVHDSLILDCHKNSLQNVINNAKLILQDTKKFEKLTGKPFQIPMIVDIKYDKTWGLAKLAEE